MIERAIICTRTHTHIHTHRHTHTDTHTHTLTTSCACCHPQVLSTVTSEVIHAHAAPRDPVDHAKAIQQYFLGQGRVMAVVMNALHTERHKHTHTHTRVRAFSFQKLQQ